MRKGRDGQTDRQTDKFKLIFITTLNEGANLT